MTELQRLRSRGDFGLHRQQLLIMEAGVGVPGALTRAGISGA
jgi:hypothetical protein